MKNILMIAPSCYPVTGAEAIVNIKLLQALSRSKEFKIDLISRRWKWENYPSDELNSFGVSLNCIKVVEVDNKINFKTIIQNLLTYLYFGILKKGYHWSYAAWVEIKSLVKRNKYDYVLTKDVPSLVLGYHLKIKYGLKWVATWNDPCPWAMYPQPYGKGLNAKLTKMERRIIEMMKNADIHIFPNPRLRDYMNQYLFVDSKKCYIIPHVVIPQGERNHTYSNKLRLIHSGNVGHPRNPSTFLCGLKSFLEMRPDANISFTIMGHCDSSVKNLISKLELADYVEFIPPVEYKESLRRLCQYDIAVIIEANCQEGIFLPTKVSDFMQMFIPIFAISPQTGILNDLYLNKYISYFAPVNDINSIARQINLMYHDFEDQNISVGHKFDSTMTIKYVIEKYSTF